MLGTARDLGMELFQHHEFMFVDYDTLKNKHLRGVLFSSNMQTGNITEFAYRIILCLII